MSPYKLPPLLASIDSPAGLKGLSVEQLQQLCDEIRQYLIEVIVDVGGHFASSLGAVELTVALHHVYDAPRDKIVWDVGHQGYVHKILTGRRDQLPTIRRYEGISGFLKRSESEYDAFGAGHASTAISAALGMAVARDRKGEDFEVVAVVGDGGMTGGLSFEGLNNAGAINTDFTVILNDNRMSISPNVGALSRHLAEIITDPLYNRLKGEIWKAMGKAPFSDQLRNLSKRIEESLKNLVSPGMFFENLGFKYAGPIDGHNVADLVTILRKAKDFNKPLLVHVITRKGCGHESAEADPIKWHGVKAKAKPKPDAKPVPVTDGPPTYTDVFGKTMLQIAERDPRLIAITAAMSTGTGLVEFSERYPQRFFDVGIAEGHAVTFAGGLASEGFRPVCAIYSTFLQRAIDHLVHDVSIQKLPVIFCLDRAGLAGEDGPTHHGNLDLAYLSCVPGMVVAAPKDGNELRDLLFTAMAYNSGPFAIRYPKDESWVYDRDVKFTPIPIGRWEILRPGSDACILAVGSMVRPALQIAEQLATEKFNVQIVNARFVKPLDMALLEQIIAKHDLIITLEEGVIRGGFGQAVGQVVHEHDHASVQVRAMGIDDVLVTHGTRAQLLDLTGLSVAKLTRRVRELLEARATAQAKGKSRLRLSPPLPRVSGAKE
ncbi:MAG: 1-deoxy-D-xylulose-5-phosphate synthase [candidate division Zixibacteria bacterium]|nr:1-deoxy-D-xylulose-5-phosphate synthase [candidate division Zixibacteria bacterium]